MIASSDRRGQHTRRVLERREKIHLVLMRRRSASRTGKLALDTQTVDTAESHNPQAVPLAATTEDRV